MTALSESGTDCEGLEDTTVSRLRQRILQTKPFIDICSYTTRETCPETSSCHRVHFIRALRPHTEVSLGDCSYLNTCHRMETCRYVHWALEDPRIVPGGGTAGTAREREEEEGMRTKASPPQFINVDLRTFDFSIMGQFDVIVADPPWAIHQELPYGTLTDTEMMQMPVGSMQNAGGLLFLWVTGRAMELGRDCLAAWKYERIDEIVWVKTNQLQRLIRTGRTGHWLNHTKEHCIVAVRQHPDGSPAEIPPWIAKGLDTQVIISEVRETSRKPDEMYDMVERALIRKPNARKLEIFGRQHNVRPGWMTLGNQFTKPSQVYESDLVQRYNMRYPERPIVVATPET